MASSILFKMFFVGVVVLAFGAVDDTPAVPTDDTYVAVEPPAEDPPAEEPPAEEPPAEEPPVDDIPAVVRTCFAYFDKDGDGVLRWDESPTGGAIERLMVQRICHVTKSDLVDYTLQDMRKCRPLMALKEGEQYPWFIYDACLDPIEAEQKAREWAEWRQRSADNAYVMALWVRVALGIVLRYLYGVTIYFAVPLFFYQRVRRALRKSPPKGYDQVPVATADP
jgi:hypothetical protein